MTEENHGSNGISRRRFLQGAGRAGALLGLAGAGRAQDAPGDADGGVVPGFEEQDVPAPSGEWVPFSERKVRVGIAGYGMCKFGAKFGFQDHPNVEVVAVTDLLPARCAELARVVRCDRTYPSCEELLDDDAIEAVFLATDAPSHARLAIRALERGKHVAAAVPAVFGSLEEADRLLEAVRKSGRKYMMFETSAFHADLFAVAPALRRRGPRPGDLLGGRVLPLFPARRSAPTTRRRSASTPTAGGGASLRSGIPRTRTPTTSA